MSLAVLCRIAFRACAEGVEGPGRELLGCRVPCQPPGRGVPREQGTGSREPWEPSTRRKNTMEGAPPSRPSSTMSAVHWPTALERGVRAWTRICTGFDGLARSGVRGGESPGLPLRHTMKRAVSSDGFQPGTLGRATRCAPSGSSSPARPLQRRIGASGLGRPTVRRPPLPPHEREIKRTLAEDGCLCKPRRVLGFDASALHDCSQRDGEAGSRLTGA